VYALLCIHASRTSGPHNALPLSARAGRAAAPAPSPIAIHHSARDWVRLFGVLIAAAAAAQILVEDFAVAIAGTKELIRSHLPWPLGHIWISSPSGRTTAEQGEKEEPRSDSYSMTQTWTLSRRQQNLAHWPREDEFQCPDVGPYFPFRGKHRYLKSLPINRGDTSSASILGQFASIDSHPDVVLRIGHSRLRRTIAQQLVLDLHVLEMALLREICAEVPPQEGLEVCGSRNIGIDVGCLDVPDRLCLPGVRRQKNRYERKDGHVRRVKMERLTHTGTVGYAQAW
jgi:hypothetical protein